MGGVRLVSPCFSVSASRISIISGEGGTTSGEAEESAGTIFTIFCRCS